MMFGIGIQGFARMGALRFGFWMGVVLNYAFLRHSGKILDFYSENPTTCYLTFATETRYYFALGDMDCDNHTVKDE